MARTGLRDDGGLILMVRGKTRLGIAIAALGALLLFAACSGHAAAGYLVVTLKDGSQVTYNIPVDESQIQSVALGSSEKSLTDAEAAIATVDGEIISKLDFYIALSDAAGRPVLEQMIGELLLDQAAARAGVTVSKEEVEQEFEGVRQQVGPDFENLLAQYGMTADDLRRNIEISLLVFEISTKDIVITQEQIGQYYAEHVADFETPEKVRASHILVETEADAEAALDMIGLGADFAEVAAAVSLDPVSAKNGGDLGFFDRGRMVKEFEDAAFALGVGEISSIVKTAYGYHIIQVTDRAQAYRVSCEEVAGTIERMLKSNQAMKPAELLAALRESSLIVVFDPRFTDLGTAPLP